MTRVTLCAIAALILAPAAHAAAARAPTADELTEKNYVLTVDKVRRYLDATKALRAAEAKTPALKSEEDKAGQEPQKSLADLRAKLMRHPTLSGFYMRAGLSTDDAILIPLTLINAGSAVAYPKLTLPMVSAQQTAFVIQNKALVDSVTAAADGE